jgi:hypothetical protein
VAAGEDAMPGVAGVDDNGNGVVDDQRRWVSRIIDL